MGDKPTIVQMLESKRQAADGKVWIDILGLGSNGDVYKWNLKTGKWELNKLPERAESSAW